MMRCNRIANSLGAGCDGLKAAEKGRSIRTGRNKVQENHKRRGVSLKGFRDAEGEKGREWTRLKEGGNPEETKGANDQREIGLKRKTWVTMGVKPLPSSITLTSVEDIRLTRGNRERVFSYEPEVASNRGKVKRLNKSIDKNRGGVRS